MAGLPFHATIERRIDAERSNSRPSWWVRVKGMWRAMATIATGGVTIPAWLVSVLTGTILMVLVSVVGGGIVMWRDVHDLSVNDVKQDNRLDKLEGMQADVAKLSGRMEDLVDATKQTNKKVDLLLAAELAHNR